MFVNGRMRFAKFCLKFSTQIHPQNHSSSSTAGGKDIPFWRRIAWNCRRRVYILQLEDAGLCKKTNASKHNFQIFYTVMSIVVVWAELFELQKYFQTPQTSFVDELGACIRRKGNKSPPAKSFATLYLTSTREIYTWKNSYRNFSRILWKLWKRFLKGYHKHRCSTEFCNLAPTTSMYLPLFWSYKKSNILVFLCIRWFKSRSRLNLTDSVKFESYIYTYEPNLNSTENVRNIEFDWKDSKLFFN